jgi:hypothetical protein
MALRGGMARRGGRTRLSASPVSARPRPRDGWWGSSAGRQLRAGSQLLRRRAPRVTMQHTAASIAPATARAALSARRAAAAAPSRALLGAQAPRRCAVRLAARRPAASAAAAPPLYEQLGGPGKVRRGFAQKKHSVQSTNRAPAVRGRTRRATRSRAHMRRAGTMRAACAARGAAGGIGPTWAGGGPVRGRRRPRRAAWRSASRQQPNPSNISKVFF